MTSASELFYTRRHRLGRNTLDLGLDSSPGPDLLSSRRGRHERRLRHHSSPTEGSADARGMRGARVSVGGRLPAGVLLARARLVQRLTGEPVSTSRQYSRDSLDGDQERELSSDVPTVDTVITELTSQMGRSQLLQEHNEKPPGLTQEALDCLHLEVFSCRETGLESGVLQDCGICLEIFMDGDKLIRLPCGHKFHSACLDPWIRSCGDCPFCRRGIVVKRS